MVVPVLLLQLLKFSSRLGVECLVSTFSGRSVVVSAPALGAGDRGCESHRPDHSFSLFTSMRDVIGWHMNQSQTDESKRLQAIKDLERELTVETDPDELANIQLTLKELRANEPINK
jgi:hypothetical protein